MNTSSVESLVRLTVIGFFLLPNLLAEEVTFQHQFGPTGIFGNEVERVITVTKVEEGSPAHGKIEPCMQIIGARKGEFQTHLRRELADAIDVAESNEGAGKLTLLLKDGRKVDLTLAILGRYSDTAPYNCPKTVAILQR